MKLTKILGVFVLCLASMLFATSLVSAQTVSIVDVEVDGDTLHGGTETGTNVYSFDKNDEIDVKVRYSVDQDWDDVEVEVVLLGYAYNDEDRISDTSEPRDVKANTVYTERLSLPLYRDLDDGQYDLRVRIAGRRGQTQEFLYTFDIDGSGKHSVFISDVVMSPAYSVRAGGALLVTAEVENTGRKDETGVKVRVKMPELNQEATAYIQEVEKGDRTISEEAYIKIPSDTAEGDYDVVVELEYDRGREKDVVIETIHVTANPAFQQVTDDQETEGQTVVVIGPESQDVQAGTAGAVYSATLMNTGSASKTYTVAVQTSGGLDVTVSPSNVVVVDGGESESVYLYVSANEASPAGEQLFVVSINSGDETLEEVSLTANVVGASKTSSISKVRRGLEVGLVVLLVLLLILGLIVGFNKLKGAEDEGEDSTGQTYY